MASSSSSACAWFGKPWSWFSCTDSLATRNYICCTSRIRTQPLYFLSQYCGGIVISVSWAFATGQTQGHSRCILFPPIFRAVSIIPYFLLLLKLVVKKILFLSVSQLCLSKRQVRSMDFRQKLFPGHDCHTICCLPDNIKDTTTWEKPPMKNARLHPIWTPWTIGYAIGMCRVQNVGRCNFL